MAPSKENIMKLNPDFSITDLKALFRGYKYVKETIKPLPEKPDPV